MAKKVAKETRNEKMEKAFQMIEKGIATLPSSEQWKSYLKLQANFYNYSFFNTLLILVQKPNATYVAPYSKWQQMGRQVMAKEKSLNILAPSFKKATVEKTNEKGEIEKAEVQKLAYFITVPVFDVSQTKGEELPNVVHVLQGETDLYSIIKEVCTFPIHEKEDCDGANGYYHKKNKDISILSSLSTLHKTKTAIHEWAHGELHGEETDELSRQVKELEAESVAFIVCHALGLDTGEYSFGYLASWGGGEKAMEKIKKSGQRIQKTANKILETILPKIEVEKESEEKLEYAV